MQNLSQAIESLGLARPFGAIGRGGDWLAGDGPMRRFRSPIDGAEIAAFAEATPAQASQAAENAAAAFLPWRTVPAPLRGEAVRRIGEAFRRHKQSLAALIVHEVGKIPSEALGEVQEMIDICDFAVGLSRQLYGLSIASERPEHRLTEQWHPLGAVGVITAFNFPMAVWAWNAMIALVCGDTILWKPSEKTPLCAIACQSVASRAVAEALPAYSGVLSLAIGGAEAGMAIAKSPRLPLISATGSVPMGRAVAIAVAQRLGRSLLELGGNNAAIVAPSADLDLAVRSIVFSAAGTCGQRCTTLRRLIVHHQVAPALVRRLTEVYGRLPIGDPRQEGVLIGPLIDSAAGEAMARALDAARECQATVHFGERITSGVPEGGCYVRPAIVEIDRQAPIVRQETFAPILYVLRYQTLEEAIALQNDVPQGLASAIFTSDVREAERFCSATGSDCGIANVNIGPSGAEIGGAFGGEKETGGGRESGADSWKAYMRRATNTINYSTALPLAQGVKFDVT